MEINKISKIQFRQDTYSNFYDANPILAFGEPAFVDDGGIYKLIIGDGVNNFRTLIQHPYMQATESIDDAPATGELYVRTRNDSSEIGTWFSISEKYNKLTLSDLLNAEYETEVDMHYDITLHDGTTKRVYGKRYYFEVSKEASIPDARVLIDSGINSIVEFGGTVAVDNDHTYAVTSHGPSFTFSLYIDNENHSHALYMYSVSEQIRENAPIDIWVLYTKI